MCEMKRKSNGRNNSLSPTVLLEYFVLALEVALLLLVTPHWPIRVEATG